MDGLDYRPLDPQDDHSRTLLDLHQYPQGKVHAHPRTCSKGKIHHSDGLCEGAAGISSSLSCASQREGQGPIFPPLFGKEKVRVLEARHRPHFPQRSHQTGEVQDGVPAHDSPSHTSRRLDAINRLERRIFSCPGRPRPSKIPEVRGGTFTSAVHLPAIWPDNFPPRLLEGPPSRRSPLKNSGAKTLPLLGRPASPVSEQATTPTSSKSGSVHAGPVWLVNKYGKEPPRAGSAADLSGGSLRHAKRDNFPPRGENIVCTEQTSPLPFFPPHVSSDVPQDGRNYVLNHPHGQMGPMADAPVSERVPTPMGFPRSVPANPGDIPYEAFHPLVAQQEKPSKLPLTSSDQLEDHNIGCQQLRLGSPLRTPHGPGQVGVSNTGHSLQRAGAQGSLSSPSSLQPLGQGVPGVATSRQYHGCGIHQKTGGDAQQTAASGGKPYHELGSRERAKHLGSFPPRVRELPSRLSIQSFSHRQRVVSTQQGIPVDHVLGSDPRDRPVRLTFQQEAGEILCPRPGPTCSRHRCTIGPLEVPDRLRLSPNTVDRAIPTETHEGIGISGSSSSTMAQQALVPDAVPSQREGPSSSSHQAGPSLHRKNSTSLSIIPAPAGLVVEGERLTAAGCPQGVIRTLLNARRPATNRVYEQIWGKFSEQMISRNRQPSSPEVSDVLLFLQSGLDLGLAVSTLKVHVSALSAFSGTSWANHRLLRQFFRGACRLRPQRLPRFPKWDLPLVLRFWSLLSSENSGSLSIKQLTVKTAFLVAITSAKRVSDIHNFGAVEPYLTFFPDRVVLIPMLGAKPKVTSVFHENPEITLPTYSTSADSEFHALDVGHALSAYLQATAAFRCSNHLFVLLCGRNKGKAASTRTIASWIVQAVQWAYRANGMTPPEAISAHSTRGILHHGRRPAEYHQKSSVEQLHGPPSTLLFRIIVLSRRLSLLFHSVQPFCLSAMTIKISFLSAFPPVCKLFISHTYAAMTVCQENGKFISILTVIFLS